MKTSIIGNIGHFRRVDKESGSFLSLSVAVDRKKKGITETEWVEVVLFGTYMNVEPYLEVGRLIYADGPSHNERFNKGDGSAGFVTKIKANSFQFLDSAVED